MKENVEKNNELLKILEENKDIDVDIVRNHIECYFNISRHSLRAWFSRLANPNKYDGKYAERMKPFLRAAKTKPVVESPNTDHLGDVSFQIGDKYVNDDNANIVMPMHHPVITEHGVVAIPSKELLEKAYDFDAEVFLVAKPKYIPQVTAQELGELEEMLDSL